MEDINDVLGSSTAPEPPTRDIDGAVSRARKLALPGHHAFARADEDKPPTRLPAPEQWLLPRMSEMDVAEMIERHIDYVDENGRSVHLPTKFVRHYVSRDDGALPTVVAIATLPIVLGDASAGARWASIATAASSSRSRRSCEPFSRGATAAPMPPSRGDAVPVR